DRQREDRAPAGGGGCAGEVFCRLCRLGTGAARSGDENRKLADRARRSEACLRRPAGTMDPADDAGDTVQVCRPATDSGASVNELKSSSRRTRRHTTKSKKTKFSRIAQIQNTKFQICAICVISV